MVLAPDRGILRMPSAVTAPRLASGGYDRDTLSPGSPLRPRGYECDVGRPAAFYHASVRKGRAGRPSLLKRLAQGLRCDQA